MYGNSAFKTSTLKPIIQNIIRPTLAEFGKIKIGGKGETRKKNNSDDTWQIPVKYDHFVITTLVRGEDNNFIKDTALHQRLLEKYGAEPKRIPIRLLYNDPAMNFPSRLVCYKGKTQVCSGDGENANRKTEQGMKTVPCPCNHFGPEYEGTEPCKMNGVLSCVIEGTEKLGGVYKFRTTSFNSVQSITTSLFWIQNQTKGILAGLPLELVLNTKTGTNPKTGKAEKIHYVTIEFIGNIQNLLSESTELQKQEAAYSREIKLIEAQAEEIVRNDMDSELSNPEEFYPEKAVMDGETETMLADGTKVDTETGEILEETPGTEFEVKAVKSEAVKTEPVKKAVKKPAPVATPVEPEPRDEDVPEETEEDVF